ncbi:hypothetical protein SAMN05444412_115105 [Rhodonellum ikkaensis]|uniref:Uncharacterized protein n=1 Tax=Rhodonellum ikkaensis TaxID=336829 RepID=A0A1H3T6Z6_9BACT|nr:hypothetical protein SAMN05444412_115105 [Rhodonellum ikkaensis]
MGYGNLEHAVNPFYTLRTQLNIVIDRKSIGC